MLRGRRRHLCTAVFVLAFALNVGRSLPCIIGRTGARKVRGGQIFLIVSLLCCSWVVHDSFLLIKFISIESLVSAADSAHLRPLPLAHQLVKQFAIVDQSLTQFFGAGLSLPV